MLGVGLESVLDQQFLAAWQALTATVNKTALAVRVPTAFNMT